MHFIEIFNPLQLMKNKKEI